MRRSLLLAVPLLAILIAGCQDVSTIAIACRNSTQCPSNDYCGSDNICHRSATCVAPLHVCGADCVPFDTTANCGACGAACAPGNVCDAVTDPSTPACKTFCGDGTLVDCGGTCRDPKNDPANCGACGTVCGAGLACIGGQCSALCPGSEKLCTDAHGASSCVNKLTDLNNCGSCGNVCPVGDYCVNGGCQPQCAAPLELCDNGSSSLCVNKNIDAANCGACGHACATGEICSGGACEVQCASGMRACVVGGVSACIDVQSDQLHCGSCGNPCGAGEACVSGSCQPNCPTGQLSCSGVCATVATDPNHCGICERQCASGESCQSGLCTLSCQAGLSPCDTNIDGGGPTPTCVNKQSDPSNCGVCGRSCPALQVCVNGGCALNCPAGLAACNGTCVSEASDPNNCGGCGAADGGAASHICATGLSCQGGSCAPGCPNGSLLCTVATDGGTPDAGVRLDGGSTVVTCVDPATDSNNCGACGHSCGAGTTCSGNSCVATCGLNEKLCGATCQSIANDPNNCGDCSVHLGDGGTTHVCAAGQSCSNGSCRSNCGASESVCPDGLCYDLQNDPKNCGACTHGCDPGQICSGGICGPSCPNVCSGVCTNTNIDPANCGGCGSGCGPYNNGTAVCSSHSCAVLCTPGFGDCDNSLGNGCETALNTASNCGACGNACAKLDNANATCTGSHCGSSCQTGFGDCDGDATNGCEANEANDSANCGGCNSACSGFCTATGCQAATAGLPAGVLQDVTLTSLTAAGYSLCFSDVYSDPNAGSIDNTGVLANCAGTRLVMGCRFAGSPTLLLAAGAARSSVLTATSGGATTSANGVNFYLNGHAWGFAPGAAAVDLSGAQGNCDVGGPTDAAAPGYASQRLCWLTSGNTLGAGARCGDKQSLGSSTAFERVILSAP